MPDVLFEKRPDGVALITLNRPESMNAMGGELMSLLGDALTEGERDRAVRCIAITGAGRGFCAGGDIKGFAAGLTVPASGAQARSAAPPQRTSTGVSLERGVERLRGMQNSIAVKLRTLPKPVVALVNGAAAGAGMSLALACDIRVFSDRGRLVPAFARIAFSGDFGGSFFLSNLVGTGRAREIYFLGEPLDAQKCLELGIANHVHSHDDLLERGLELCARLADGPTGAIGRMKSNFNLAEHATLQECLDQEALHMELSRMTNDWREGIAAFGEKRDPVFTGE